MSDQPTPQPQPEPQPSDPNDPRRDDDEEFPVEGEPDDDSDE